MFDFLIRYRVLIIAFIIGCLIACIWHVYPNIIALLALALFVVSALFSYTLYLLQRRTRLAAGHNQYVAAMAHDMKSPIATISIALEALQDEETLNDAAIAKECLVVARIEADKLTYQVDKVLRQAMFEYRNPMLRHDPLDLNVLIESILPAFQWQAEQRSGSIRFEPEKDTRYAILGDNTHLTSVVANLLENALKYSTGIPVIQVTLHRKAQSIYLRISDQGIGIAIKHQEQIFEPFYRVQQDSSAIKGHGIGLHYVAHVVRRHGGSVRVQSKEGAGSMFEVMLPAMN